MHGHLQDRVCMPLVLARHDREAMEQVAITEWMAASPVYSRRMQRALRFEGDGVDTIFKNLQLDIGAPHRFMDFRLVLRDHDHGEFFLAHCGALMDVEPLGDDFVHGMCHSIEDPTFDATAAATNPRAQIRPIHRPPRRPADRQPHCHWTVQIDPSHPEVAPHPYAELVAQSVAARCVVTRPRPGAEPGGWDDYSGPFDPDFELEDLSLPALVVALQEFALQSHLLVRGYGLAVADLEGAEAAGALIADAVVGVAGVTAQRLARAFYLGSGTHALAALLQLHPLFWPRTYVTPYLALDEDGVRFSLSGDAPVFSEPDGLTWLAALPGPAERALGAIGRVIDPRMRVRSVAPTSGERCAYEFVLDPAADPAPEEREVLLGMISTGATFELPARRPVRHSL